MRKKTIYPERVSSIKTRITPTLRGMMGRTSKGFWDEAQGMIQEENQGCAIIS